MYFYFREDPRNEIFLPDISASEEYVEKSGTESELQQTANEVVSALDDSKFTYSKVINECLYYLPPFFILFSCREGAEHTCT